MAHAKPDAGHVERITVKAKGAGPNAQVAVNQALQLAMEQVTGKTISSSSTQFEAGLALAVGDESISIGSAGFANLIQTRSRGAITDFQLVSQKKTSDGVEVEIQASVAKFARPPSADRLRVAIAPFRVSSGDYTIDSQNLSAGSVVEALQTKITNGLTQSGRVAVLDRQFSSEVNGELEQITNGTMANEEMARLGQGLSADYLLVGKIDQFGYERHERQLRSSERTLVSHSGGASISLRLINVTTGQVELADDVSVNLPETTPTTLGTSVNASAIETRLISELSDKSISKIVGRLFPITVVAISGDDIVLSQGRPAVKPGLTYSVVERGAELKDPQTGQSLGRIEKDCCAVTVTKVTDQLAYATFAASSPKYTAALVPGALEVREVVDAAPEADEQSVPAAAPVSSSASSRPVATTAPTPHKKAANVPAAPPEDTNW